MICFMLNAGEVLNSIAPVKIGLVNLGLFFCMCMPFIIIFNKCGIVGIIGPHNKVTFLSIKLLFYYLSIYKYVLGAQKNRLRGFF